MTDEDVAVSRIQGFEAVGFFPADHAASESGKVYTNGAYWNVLRFPVFPAVLPFCALVAVLRLPFHASHANHSFEIDMEDADGKPQKMKVGGQFRAAPGIDTKFGESGLIPISVPVNGLGFERPGDYAFVLRVDSEVLTRYPFHVVQVFQQQPLAPVEPPGEHSE